MDGRVSTALDGPFVSSREVRDLTQSRRATYKSVAFKPPQACPGTKDQRENRNSKTPMLALIFKLTTRPLQAIKTRSSSASRGV